MMSPIIITEDKKGEIRLTVKQLTEMLEDAYEEGKKDGQKNLHGKSETIGPWAPIVTYTYAPNTNDVQSIYTRITC